MRQPKLLDQVRQCIRLKHLSKRTEEAYVQWIKRYVVFHNKRHPAEIGENEIRSFLTYLAREQHVFSSIQNQVFIKISPAHFTQYQCCQASTVFATRIKYPTPFSRTF